MTTIEGARSGAGWHLMAPAKVNLALHVTGRREDGYHLLDSLVVFAGHGDLLTVTPAQDYSLTIGGPRGAGLPAGEDNLCLRAARLAGTPVAIHLEKHLPAEAGLGGGSADAAAVLRAVAALTDQPLPEGTERLGADVPVCTLSRAARMTGIGQTVTPLPGLPRLPALLVNPGLPMATPPVFRALTRRDNAPLSALPDTPDTTALIRWLAHQRNDLEGAAISIAPQIGGVLDRLRDLPGCRLARMSGSGASCFALFDEMPAAALAGAELAKIRPEWWISPAFLG